jgi:hypothetical protein
VNPILLPVVNSLDEPLTGIGPIAYIYVFDH